MDFSFLWTVLIVTDLQDTHTSDSSNSFPNEPPFLLLTYILSILKSLPWTSLHQPVASYFREREREWIEPHGNCLISPYFHFPFFPSHSRVLIKDMIIFNIFKRILNSPEGSVVICSTIDNVLGTLKRELIAKDVTSYFLCILDY